MVHTALIILTFLSIVTYNVRTSYSTTQRINLSLVYSVQKVDLSGTVKMSEPLLKRKRITLSVDKKKAICHYKQNNPSASLKTLINYFSQEWGIKIGLSTMSEVLGNSKKWLSVDGNADLAHLKTCKQPKLEEALYLWFLQMQHKKVVVSNEMLVEKARKFGAALKIENFQYSNGWIIKFKQRHKISMKKIHGEAGASNVNDIDEGRQDLVESLSGYNLDNLYNMDETALFYKLQPNSTLSTKNVSGQKNKQRTCHCWTLLNCFWY